MLEWEDGRKFYQTLGKSNVFRKGSKKTWRKWQGSFQVLSLGFLFLLPKKCFFFSRLKIDILLSGHCSHMGYICVSVCVWNDNKASNTYFKFILMFFPVDLFLYIYFFIIWNEGCSLLLGVATTLWAISPSCLLGKSSTNEDIFFKYFTFIYADIKITKKYLGFLVCACECAWASVSMCSF